ncbi:MAG TPA: TraB/GumN family protein [Candidatus Kapabacteria bacterium]|nr:TraB/GumN family protein [Candidatus Kapabacteria bacterium]
MFERLRVYLNRSGNLVAVGALHLPGEHGLLQLLRKAGYRVQPVRP